MTVDASVNYDYNMSSAPGLPAPLQSKDETAAPGAAAARACGRAPPARAGAAPGFGTGAYALEHGWHTVRVPEHSVGRTVRTER